MVIEYNKPNCRGPFFRLGVPCFTAACVATRERNMKLIVNWLDPKLHPTIMMVDLMPFV
jgi:L,D-peptidoglycan transpeptidase YkuD (ErfK/YbiS/YcfS/YnhG family)